MRAAEENTDRSVPIRTPLTPKEQSDASVGLPAEDSETELFLYIETKGHP